MNMNDFEFDDEGFEFYQISSAAAEQPAVSQEEQLRQQQLRIHQQMNAAPPKQPSGPSGVAAQPYQKINLITSKDAADLRSSASSGGGGEGPLAPGPIVSKAPPKKIDPEMINEFLKGGKNPGMVLNEFCQKQRLSISFQEAPPPSWGTFSNPQFASVALVDGVKHKPGTGRTKKEAKNNAAKIALTTLLGLDEEDVHEPEYGTAIYDSRGRKTIMMDGAADMYSQNMAAPSHAANQGSYSSGGHFQLNYNNAVTITDEEAWRKPKQEKYIDYQVRKEAEELERQRNAAAAQQPNGHGYQPPVATGQSYAQQADQQTRLPSTTSRAAAFASHPGPDPNASKYVKELQKDDKITTFHFPETERPLVRDAPEEGGSAFPTNRRRNLPMGKSPFAGLADEPGHVKSEPISQVTSIGMAWLKKNPEKEGVKPAPKSGVRLGDLMPSDAPTKTIKTTADPGIGMGYQDKAKQVPMQSQAAPQFVHNTQPPQPVGLTQPARMRNPASFNQPMQPAGMMGQPARPNLMAQPVRPNYTAAAAPPQPIRAPPPDQSMYQSSQGAGEGDFGKGQLTKADNISTAARRVPAVGMPFPGCHGISERVSYTAFVIQPSPTMPGRIISLGTGADFVDIKKLGPDGRTVVDSHGLVIAKRGFQRFLYRELKSFYQGTQGSIFVRTQGSRLLSVKQGITFHLYMNSAPHGDAVRFLSEARDMTEVSEEDLYMMSSGEHYPVFVEDTEHGFLSKRIVLPDIVHSTRMDATGASLDELKRKDGMCIMSASDKLLMWNVIGVQGSLLNFFMEPVYLTSVTLGSQFDHGHLSRAVCCRLDDSLNSRLPEGFRVHHPSLLRVSCSPRLKAEVPGDGSINWSYADNQFEVVDPKRGRTTDSSPVRTGAIGASRICKASFFSRFKGAREMAQRHDLAYASTYTDAKAMNKGYRAAKESVLQHLKNKGYGNWVHLPQEVDRFVK
ncbi:uncharacterized protein [Amphiura filiformis]|uniref:uncharacterized protein n=1 Tax=Amphiura filiformis TaxID=82378 RepID=UPI003B2262DA